MFAGVMVFLLGNVLAWFQFNSQFVWPWWASRPMLSNIIFAVPMGLCFWYAIRHIVDATGLLWSSKLIGFGVSNMVFAILTSALLKESILVPKTMVCLVLSVAIITIQVMWK